VLFAFNRPESTKRILELALEAGVEKLYVFVDGPRADRPDDAAKRAEVLSVIAKFTERLELHPEYSTTNQGISKQVIRGLDKVFSAEDRAIILEDDCIPAPTFFGFCSELLETHKNNERVVVIGGFNPLTNTVENDESYSYITTPLTWGWATWRRVWSAHDPEAKDWASGSKRKAFLKQIPRKAGRRYWKFHLDSVTSPGAHQIWDYQFTLTCWRLKGLGVLPAVNLVSNIGFGPGATHTLDPDNWMAKVKLGQMRFPLRNPVTVAPNYEADRILSERIHSLALYQEIALRLIRSINSPWLELELRKARGVGRSASDFFKQLPSRIVHLFRSLRK
jgi:hypothetical protein